MKIICPATLNEVDTDYCGGNCINCPWVKIKGEDKPISEVSVDLVDKEN